MVNKTISLDQYRDERKPVEQVNNPSSTKIIYGLRLEDIEGKRGSPNRVPVIDVFKKDLREFLERQGAYKIAVQGTYLNEAIRHETKIYIPNVELDVYHFNNCTLTITGMSLAKSDDEEEALRDSPSKLEIEIFGEKSTALETKERIEQYLFERKSNL